MSKTKVTTDGEIVGTGLAVPNSELPRTYAQVLADYQILDSGDLFGDGTEFVDDKDSLIGREFVVIAAKFHERPEPGGSVTVIAITPDDRLISFWDSGAGIRRQLIGVTPSNGYTGPVAIRCQNGLRRSDYLHEGRAARTYYLD